MSLTCDWLGRVEAEIGCVVDAREAAQRERHGLGRGVVECVRAMAEVYEGLTGTECEVRGVGMTIKDVQGKVRRRGSGHGHHHHVVISSSIVVAVTGIIISSSYHHRHHHI